MSYLNFFKKISPLIANLFIFMAVVLSGLNVYSQTIYGNNPTGESFFRQNYFSIIIFVIAVLTVCVLFAMMKKHSANK